MKIVGGKSYKYIGNNQVEVRDVKTASLLYTSIVEDWDNVYEPVIIKIVYPSGKVKIPNVEARQVYHGKHYFMNGSYPELEERTNIINRELKRLGISKTKIGYAKHWNNILKLINFNMEVTR